MFEACLTVYFPKREQLLFFNIKLLFFIATGFFGRVTDLSLERARFLSLERVSVLSLERVTVLSLERVSVLSLERARFLSIERVTVLSLERVRSLLNCLKRNLKMIFDNKKVMKYCKA